MAWRMIDCLISDCASFKEFLFTSFPLRNSFRRIIIFAWTTILLTQRERELRTFFPQSRWLIASTIPTMRTNLRRIISTWKWKEIHFLSMRNHFKALFFQSFNEIIEHFKILESTRCLRTKCTGNSLQWHLNRVTHTRLESFLLIRNERVLHRRRVSHKFRWLLHLLLRRLQLVLRLLLLIRLLCLLHILCERSTCHVLCMAARMLSDFI